jgi:hypothetical protein
MILTELCVEPKSRLSSTSNISKELKPSVFGHKLSFKIIVKLEL